MRTFKLHSRTTLLSSVIIVAMLVAALAITSAAIANIERNDDQTLAQIQARDLAQHISDIGSQDPVALGRAATLIKGSRPNIVSVRVWELAGASLSNELLRRGAHRPRRSPQTLSNDCVLVAAQPFLRLRATRRFASSQSRLKTVAPAAQSKSFSISTASGRWLFVT